MLKKIVGEKRQKTRLGITGGDWRRQRALIISKNKKKKRRNKSDVASKRKSPGRNSRVVGGKFPKL